MKLTKTRLKQLIKEELAATLLEEDEPIINLEDTIGKWIEIYQGAMVDLQSLAEPYHCAQRDLPGQPLFCVLKAKWFKKLSKSEQAKIIQQKMAEMRGQSREWIRKGDKPIQPVPFTSLEDFKVGVQDLRERIIWAFSAMESARSEDLYKKKGWKIDAPKVLGTLLIMSDKTLALQMGLPYKGSDVLKNAPGSEKSVEEWHKYIMDKAEHVYYVEGPAAVLKKFGLVRRTGATRLKRYK